MAELTHMHARAASASRAPLPASSALLRASACAHALSSDALAPAANELLEPPRGHEAVASHATRASWIRQLAAVDNNDHQVLVLTRTPAVRPAGSRDAETAPSNTRTEAPPPTKRPRRKRKPTARQLQMRLDNQAHASQVYNLTLDINDLKQQVRDYMVYKSVHATRALVQQHNFTAGVLRTTDHFFHVFRAGYRAWEAQEQAFLATAIDSDVASGPGLIGADAFMEQWRRYKQVFPRIGVSVSSIRVVVVDADQCVVECDGELNARLSLRAIKTLFPHVLASPVLVAKLLDRRLVCPTRTVIFFDSSGHIVRYDAFTDMPAALSSLKSLSLFDVAAVMANVRMGTNSDLPEVDLDADVAIEVAL